MASSWNARISSLRRHDATVVSAVATCFPPVLHGICHQEAGEVGKYKENRPLKRWMLPAPGLKVFKSAKSKRYLNVLKDIEGIDDSEF